MKILFGICFFKTLLFAEHFVSFIVPCYNCEPWIQQTIESIYNQGLQCPFEIVCTDDASTDRTYDILCSLNRSGLKVLRHGRHRGTGAARNTCAHHSGGDLLFCLDGVHVLESNSLQALIDRHDQTKADIVAFGEARYFTDVLEPKGGVIYNRPNEEYTLRDLIQDDETPGMWGHYLFTRESFNRIFEGYPEQHSAAAGFAFAFTQLMRGSKMIYVPGTFYWHRIGKKDYVEKEREGGRLQLGCLRFLLMHKHLFTDDSVAVLQDELELVMKKKNPLSLEEFLCSKRLHLRE